MDIQFKGKTVFVSGSTSGIGYAIAEKFATSGGNVILNGRSQARLDQAIQKMKKDFPSAQVNGMVGDLSTSEGLNSITSHLSHADIIVNNLGIFESKGFFEISDDDWERFFQVNVMSGVRLSRHYIPKMVQKKWGRVIFISSDSAIQIPAEMVHYGMTKTAQLAVSRGLAESLKGTGVTVNCVLPGPTRTEGVGAFVEQLAQQKHLSVQEMEAEFFKTMRPSSLLQRFIEPIEIANLVAYVASDLASATTGAALRVDGGVAQAIF